MHYLIDEDRKLVSQIVEVNFILNQNLCESFKIVRENNFPKGLEFNLYYY